ncbi:hypothetical protein DFQ10_101153 [Winogradskyella eximia]|uniref:Uncharacterized protein n=1 Tax=Winogradskyella eximia TaxID=262006 RepID=A0A3D9HA71_9FLAO|nr:hypothetical protein DFQ10_101153 [Winogradskyella eximia]
MLKFYIKSLLLIIITVVILKVSDSFIIHDELLHYNIEKLYKEKDSCDFVYLGNSLTRRSYNAPYIDSTLNTKSICLASEAQHFYLTNSIFEDFIENKNLYPNKALIITLSPWQFKVLNEQKWWHFLQMSALDELSISKNYFSNIKEFYSYKDLPKIFSTTIRFHSEIPSQIVQTSNKMKVFNNIDPNGFVLGINSKLNKSQREEKKGISSYIDSYTKSIAETEQKELSDKSVEVLLNVIEKCKSKGIKLIFITPPSIDALYYSGEFGQRKFIKELLKSNSVSYIDFNEKFKEIGLTFDDFNDFAHLNKEGNRKLAPFMVDFLAETLDIEIKKNIEPKSEVIDEGVLDTTIINTNNLAKHVLEFNKWGKVGIVSKWLNNQEVQIKRDAKVKSSFVHTGDILVEEGEIYEASIKAKLSSKDAYIGLRILGKYPDRVDAVFDIKNQKVLGVNTYGNFTSGEANIELSKKNIIVCKVKSRVKGEKLKVLLGPTSILNKLPSWEAQTDIKNAVTILPLSLVFKKVND